MALKLVVALIETGPAYSVPVEDVGVEPSVV
jgi:hypothetical protein